MTNPLYIVFERHISGDYTADQRTSEMDRATVVKEIAQGQYEDIVRVLEIDPANGTCRDATKDIAIDVCEIWSDRGGELFDWERDFLEEWVSFEAARAFPRAA